MYDFVNNNPRRNYLGMVSHMDDGLRRIVEALEEKNMVDNTLLVFMSDVSKTNSAYNNRNPSKETQNQYYFSHRRGEERERERP